MVKIKTLITASFVTLLPTALFAATELSEQQARTRVPFKQIEIKGRYANTINAIQALSRKADKEGAASFYIVSNVDYRNSESIRLIKSNLYRKDAPIAPKTSPHFRNFGGVLEYKKEYALKFEPFDMVRLRGYFANQYTINDEIAKIGADKEAYAFYIEQQNQSNGSNTEIIAYFFKKNALSRKMQPYNAIPYDSEMAHHINKDEIEKPGFGSPYEFDEAYYTAKFSGKEPKASNGSLKYTVTLSDGQKIQELNDDTAAKMSPFSAIQFRGYFFSDTEISRQVAKRAACQGAKYYHITQILQDTKGPNITVFADLFR